MSTPLFEDAIPEIYETRNKLLGREPEPQQILKQIQDEGIRFINLQFSDVRGLVKSVTIPAKVFPNIIERGQWIDGSSIAGFTPIDESDMFLVPDLSTFAVLPWDTGDVKTARVICWVHNPDNQPFPGDSRHILLQQLKKLADMGYTFNAGPELEFFLFEREENGEIAPLPHDRAGYFDFTTDFAGTVRKDMVNALASMGIEVEASHHEIGIGQHEIGFEYGPAVRTADDAITFKYILKAIAQKHGLYATFMPKPTGRTSGSGMHVHQSFGYLDSSKGKNAFVDESDEYGLSKIARHFIAGQIKHARALTAVTGPLVNSFRRLTPGWEAPVYVAWARTNRSALIRVPAIREGNLNATRIELRSPDPSCNPYLAFAAMLAAGMDGIENELPLEDPIEENLYQFTEEDVRRRGIVTLPETLGEAIDEFRNNEVLTAALGEHTSTQLNKAQHEEWNEFLAHVTRWERDRYLETY